MIFYSFQACEIKIKEKMSIFAVVNFLNDVCDRLNTNINNFRLFDLE